MGRMGRREEVAAQLWVRDDVVRKNDKKSRIYYRHECFVVVG